MECKLTYLVPFTIWKTIASSPIISLLANIEMTSLINLELRLDFYCTTSPSVSVALRPIGATHLKLTAAMRPYSSLNLFHWFGIFGIDGTRIS